MSDTIAIIVREGKANILAGENTAQAARFASSAELDADRSEVAATIAEGLVGPSYDTVGEGLAGTVSGESFAVKNGDLSVTIYLNTSGSAVLQRELATTGALDSSADGRGGSLVRLRSTATVQQAISAATTRALLAASLLALDVGARVQTDDGFKFDVVEAGEAFSNTVGTKFFPVPQEGKYPIGAFNETGEMLEALTLLGDGVEFLPRKIENTSAALFAATGVDPTPAKNVVVRGLTAINTTGKGFDAGRRGPGADILAEQQARTGWVIDAIYCNGVGKIDGAGGSYGFIFCGKNAVIGRVVVYNQTLHPSDDTEAIYVKMHDSTAEAFIAHNCPSHDGAVAIKGNELFDAVVGPIGTGNHIALISVSADDEWKALNPGNHPGVFFGCGGSTFDTVRAKNIDSYGFWTGDNRASDWTIDTLEVSECGVLEDLPNDIDGRAAVQLGHQGGRYRIKSGEIKNNAGIGIEIVGINQPVGQPAADSLTTYEIGDVLIEGNGSDAIVFAMGSDHIDVLADDFLTVSMKGTHIVPGAHYALRHTQDKMDTDQNDDGTPDFTWTDRQRRIRLLRMHDVRIEEASNGQPIGPALYVKELDWKDVIYTETNTHSSMTDTMNIPCPRGGFCAGEVEFIAVSADGAHINSGYSRKQRFRAENIGGTVTINATDMYSWSTTGEGANWAARATGSSNGTIRLQTTSGAGATAVAWRIIVTVYGNTEEAVVIG